MFQDEEEAGLLELLKSQICDNAALYAQKYDEEFQPYLPRFVTAIWNLLVTTGQEVKYDLVSCDFWWFSSVTPGYFGIQRHSHGFYCWLLQLVSNAIQFLASVCERPHYKHLFEDQNTLTSICEKVIVPNMEFRSMCSILDHLMFVCFRRYFGMLPLFLTHVLLMTRDQVRMKRLLRTIQKSTS